MTKQQKYKITVLIDRRRALFLLLLSASWKHEFQGGSPNFLGETDLRSETWKETILSHWHGENKCCGVL